MPPSISLILIWFGLFAASGCLYRIAVSSSMVVGPVGHFLSGQSVDLDLPQKSVPVRHYSGYSLWAISNVYFVDVPWFSNESKPTPVSIVLSLESVLPCSCHFLIPTGTCISSCRDGTALSLCNLIAGPSIQLMSLFASKRKFYRLSIRLR